MAKIEENMTISIRVKVNLSFWDALKLRLAGDLGKEILKIVKEKRKIK